VPSLFGPFVVLRKGKRISLKRIGRCNDVHTLGKLEKLYLELHSDRRYHRRCQFARYAFRLGREHFRDKCLTDITPSEVRDFVSFHLNRGLKTSSVRVVLEVLCAGAASYMREYDLAIRNPFLRVPIPREKYDRKKHIPISEEKLTAFRTACVLRDDAARWLLAIIIDTGARLGEICGLALEDIVVDHEFPHIRLVERPWRRLKTLASRRSVPLVGAALWAAHRVLDSAYRGEVYAFPKCIKNGQTSSYMSGVLKAWLGLRGCDRGVHSFRHAFIDRLREVNCPPGVRRAVMGWTDRTIEERYGYGYSLETMHAWVSRIVDRDFYDLDSLRAIQDGDSRLPPVECGRAFARIVAKLGQPLWRDIRASSTIPFGDLVRGRAYAVRHGLVTVLRPQYANHRHQTRYEVLEESERHQPHHVALRVPGYVDVQRGQRRPQRPTYMCRAECFPNDTTWFISEPVLANKKRADRLNEDFRHGRSIGPELR